MSNFENGNTYKKFLEAPSSTPNNAISMPTSRKSYRHKSISPINDKSEGCGDRQERAKSEVHSDSEELDPISSSDDDSPKHYSVELSHNRSGRSSQHQLSANRNVNERSSSITTDTYNINDVIFRTVCVLAVIVIGTVLAYVIRSELTVNTISIAEIQDNFPLQSNDTWIALQSGINEVINFNKPSVFLLLYEKESEETLNRMLQNISKYAACIINQNCETQPIVLTNAILSTENARKDYGYIVSKYKNELEQRGVMIVKNLDRVPGIVAQAFHSMCDEDTPLVKKTVFFFTIKIEHLKKLSQSDLKIVEEILRSNWHDLHDDIFHPLFTRISSMVLRIVPEKL